MLLAGLASLETEVLEVLLVEVAAVVFWVVRGGTMCGTVVFLWVKAVRIKHKSAEDEGKRGRQRRGVKIPVYVACARKAASCLTESCLLRRRSGPLS